jgi:hypothetical protein
MLVMKIKAEMDVFRPFLPVVTSLRNPGMRDRHWEALTADLGMPLKVDDVFTLRTATDTMKLHEPKTLERVQKVCERALKEYTIEKALNDMEAAWQPQDFEVMAYRNTGTSVIKLSEEVNTLLDDNIVLTQQFSFSPYKGPFEERIADWERRLRLVQEVTSEWLGCQRNWMYLQPIFDSEDIQRQLPAEAILLDRAATDLWLGAAEIGPSTATLLRPADALLLMIGIGPSGKAAERIARAAASLTDLGAETLGQDVAQAWAATRDRVVTAAPALLGAGWDFERREARRTWNEPVVDPRQEGSWVGLEATGADAHSVLLRARRLSAAA